MNKSVFSLMVFSCSAVLWAENPLKQPRFERPLFQPSEQRICDRCQGLQHSLYAVIRFIHVRNRDQTVALLETNRALAMNMPCTCSSRTVLLEGYARWIRIAQELSSIQ